MAFAGADSCNVPKEKWMPEAAFKKGIEEQGYKIKTFKVNKGQCYEIYGTDKDRQESRASSFDPASGRVLDHQVSPPLVDCPAPDRHAPNERGCPGDGADGREPSPGLGSALCACSTGRW